MCCMLSTTADYCRYHVLLLCFQILKTCIKHMAEEVEPIIGMGTLTPLGLQLLHVAQQHRLLQLLEKQESLWQEVVARGRAYGELYPPVSASAGHG